jgi:hypothetical protein
MVAGTSKERAAQSRFAFWEREHADQTLGEPLIVEAEAP